MFRKYLSLTLSLLLLNAVGAPAAFAVSGQGSQAHTAEMKTWVAKRGVGKSARVAVKMFDKTKVEGYIKEAREDDFVVVQDKTEAGVTVPYSQVKSLDDDTRSNSKRARDTAIGAGAVFGVIFLIVWGVSRS